jgi:3-dehydroquinate synthase
MAYSITLAHSRGLINDAQRDEWFTLVSSVGLSMDHELFTEELLSVATEAIKWVHAKTRSAGAHVAFRKTRDGKQRFAVPDSEFGKCVFLNDVPLDELRSVLRVHKDFVKSRFGSGDGLEAYVAAGDLGAEPEAYAKGNAEKVNGVNGHADVKTPANSLKRKGINGEAPKMAAVKAGGVPVDSTGIVTNGVSAYSVNSSGGWRGCFQITGTTPVY